MQTLFKKNEIVFIGSGVASLSCAIELSKNTKKKIVILDCGNFNYDKNANLNHHKAEVINYKYDQINIRYKGFLGNLNYWYGWCRPVFNDVLEDWGKGDKNFVKDVNKYEKATNDFFNLKSKFEPKYIEKKYEIFTMQAANKAEINSKIKKEIKISKNIEIFFNHRVFQIEKYKNYYKIYFFKNKKKNFIYTKFLILGLGCIENVKLLLYSKLHSKSNFLKNHQNIGKKFYDHMQIETGKFTAIYSKFTNIFKFKDHLFTENNLYFMRDLELVKKKFNNSFTFTFEKHPDYFKNLVRQSMCKYPFFNDKITKIINDKLCMRGILFNFQSSEKSYLKLSESLDSDKINEIKLHFYAKNNFDTMKNINNGIKDFLKFLVNTKLGRGFYYNELEQNNFNKFGTGLYHHMGGTAMGTNINNGCVNKDLELFDNKNLFIVGSSNFPPGSIINPTYTIVQLSLRLANKLKKII